MGTPILSWPFRLTATGAIATVDQDDQGADAEQIGVLILTIQGEREMEPGFGIPDPVFRGIDSGAIVNGVRLYGPPVRIDNVLVSTPDAATQAVQVNFT